MNLLTALLNRPSPEIRLDDYPYRPLDNGERRARWAMYYYALSNHDNERNDASRKECSVLLVESSQQTILLALKST